MVVALVKPPLIIAVVLGLFTVIIVGCLAAITAAKFTRERRWRLDAPVQEELSALPAAVALDEVAPPAPIDPRARRVARDMVIDATFALDGEARTRAIRWFEDNGFVQDAIWHMEHCKWRGIRPACALRLGRMRSPLAADVLAEGLRDPDYRVRDTCATALGRVGSKDHVEDLVDALARRDVPRGILSNALLQLTPEADAGLIACLDNPDAAARELVAQVLGMRAASGAVNRLMELLHDEAAPVRREAVLAIGGIAAQASVQVDPAPLSALRNDDASIVRSAVATSIGTILGDDAAPILSEMCRDVDYWVSHRAAESLCRLPSGATFGWEVLAGLDNSAQGRQAKAACLEWMERTGGIERRIEEIMERGDDADLIVTLAVLEEIGSRAWGDLFSTVPSRAGIPVDAEEVAA